MAKGESEGVRSLIDELEVKPDSTVKCSLCGADATVYSANCLPLLLSIFEECDEQDQPNGRFIILCSSSMTGCRDSKFLDDHPRLYIERYFSEGDVCPGAMPQCNSCQFRNGLECAHPSRWTGGLLFGSAPRSDIEWSSNKLIRNHAPVEFRACLSRLGLSKKTRAQRKPSKPADTSR